MSSALAIILVAAMGSPRIDPKQVSGEVDIPRLDMYGRWEGTFLYTDGVKIIAWKAEIAEGTERLYNKGQVIGISDWKIVDEGKGKLLLNGNPNKSGWGSYKVEGNRVTIVFSDMPDPRPQDFHVDKGQAMLILHRVKPCK